MNGGTCIDGLDSFLCDCVAGYTDSICSTGKHLHIFIIFLNSFAFLKKWYYDFYLPKNKNNKQKQIKYIMLLKSFWLSNAFIFKENGSIMSVKWNEWHFINVTHSGITEPYFSADFREKKMTALAILAPFVECRHRRAYFQFPGLTLNLQ